MFYRRKIILALLQQFGGRLEKTAFQKLLFLLSLEQKEPSYYFVPYHYGCYSFSAHADIQAMVKHGLLQSSSDDKSIIKNDNVDYISPLRDHDRKSLQSISLSFRHFDTNELLYFTYTEHCYYAINSIIANSILSTEEYEKVEKTKPNDDSTTLYTIGYEGVSIEEYFNKLIQNNINVLCDVRHTPLSMKYGFSQKQLRFFCENLDIQYVHIPDVGIPSSMRKSLKTQEDYDELFDIYKDKCLTSTLTYQKEILGILSEHGRIALTCFEANICQCHRKPLSEAIASLSDKTIRIIHL